MGSQQYGIGAGLQSLGASMMQAATMYELLNEKPVELEEELTPEQKIERTRQQALVDTQTANTDARIDDAYDGLNAEFGGGLTQEEIDEWDISQPPTENSSNYNADLSNFGKLGAMNPYMQLMGGN